MWKLARASAPPFRPRGSDVAATCSRFSIITDRPKVTSTGASTPCRSARPNSSTCSARPDHERDGQQQRQRDPDRHAERGGQHEPEVGATHGQVAVGQVDDPHHAERQREPAGDERVLAAEQQALDDRVDPGHVAASWSSEPREGSLAEVGGHHLLPAHRRRPGRPAPPAPRAGRPGRRTPPWPAAGPAPRSPAWRRPRAARSASGTARRPLAAPGRARSRRAAAARAPRPGRGRSPPPAARRRTRWTRAARAAWRSSGRRRRSGRAASRPRRPRPRPTWMFSSTVRLANSLRPSGTRAMPREIRRCGGAAVRSEPP